ncbi:MAG: T9SS type A sorting domain-containing protein [Saprospiraceae bacterium]|nr:T9SS type A sorting domain-containing protein [Saprospiraceae bacterium]MCB9326259.1 T9SS type A sorting domain-containing protein [Lewinellaceae bacterium]
MGLLRHISLVAFCIFIVGPGSFYAQTTVVEQLLTQRSESYLPQPKYPELFKTIPLINDASPEWVKLMYSESPNYFDIIEAYNIYYASHDFVKNTHTQNYRYFNRIVSGEHYYAADGTIYIPNAEEIQAQEAFFKEKYEAILERQGLESRLGNWSAIGPFETFATDGITYKSSQVNVYAIDQATSNPNVMYAGSEGGGLFKTIDKGVNWTAISEEMDLGGIGAIEVDPNNENIVFMAQGNRLYKTVNGGSSWTILDDITNLKITDISINPSNSNVVLTAGEKGLKRSIDGGLSWVTILSDKCWDIELKTDDPNTVFVAKTNPAMVRTEIWKSTDNGQTFFAKTTGWFNPIGGVAASTGGARIGVTNADPNRIYVILIGEENDAVDDNNYIGIYRSDDAGESWHTPYDGNGDGNPDNEPGGPYSDDHWCFTHFGLTTTGYNQGFYDLAIDVSDTDPDKFLVGSLNLFKSDDGGVSYTAWGGYQCQSCGSGYRHPDIQEIEINGADVWVTSDGGIDYYDSNLNFISSRTKGINGSAYWGLGQGWNEDVVTGGRYHNGNGAHYEGYPAGQFLALGGGEAASGYVSQGENRKVYHSDISGKLLPATITGGVSDITNYSLFPNESYVPNTKSEIVTDPRSWNILYLGNGNKVWKSVDGGSSFNVIGSFGTSDSDKVLGIEISRNNPDVIYAVQRISGGGKVWKTLNGGTNWTELTLPSTTTEMYISVSAEDENEIYLALDNGYSNANKVFRSTNGGSSWANISNSIFNGEWPKAIHVQDGTNGGLYLVTTKKVYYRNNISGWKLYSDGLPAKINYEGFLPFYRDEKIRLATENKGLWESDFYEPSSLVAQPMVDKAEGFCTRDTFYFEDYSIRRAGASWTWSFSPAPLWVSSTTVRNPKVVFGAVGSFTVTMTVTNAGGGSDAKTVTNMVTITAECDADKVPGNAMQCSNDGDYANVPNMNLTTNTITFTAWVKPNGIQPDYSGIVMNDGTTAGMNFREGKLAYHWPNGAWWWNSGLVVPDNEWSYVALVATPSGITLYVNGVGATHNFSAGVVDFGTMKLGSYKGWGGRNFNGDMDEVCIYDRALSQDEIRELMHLTKVPSADASLIHYYQFNRASGIVTDRAGNLHATLASGAVRTLSTAPVGGGRSYRMSVTNGGVKVFPNTDLTLEFPPSGIYPNGELVVSKLEVVPDQTPGIQPTPEKRYWIVNNYGTNTTFSALTSLKFDGLSGITTANSGSEYKLHKRASTAHGNTWSSELDYADAATSTSLIFGQDNSISSFGQLAINKASAVLPVELIGFTVTKKDEKSALLNWQTASEINTTHFEVERSRDGQQFQYMTTVMALGNPNEGAIYSMEDPDPFKGTTYYRLKMVDVDGRFAWSPIRSIVLNALPEQIMVYPNPVSDSRVLNIKSVFNTPVNFEMFDASGKRVRSAVIENGNGTVGLKDLPAGAYFFLVKGDAFMKNGRLIVE